ncbi:MAG: RNA polymerase sigma factor, sigma-70 family [Parcubacteria group bacterium GW2011_GWA2_47_26]|nr:MAG: RNA polymerase sigma factor, sigma-70 family [Parcubacteria group bacterium GW2011_GWA2_47_26]
MADYSDEQLIKDYLEGNKQTLEVLIGRYLKPIYGFVYRYLGDAHNAEDVTQDVFVKIWRNLKKFDRDKNFKTWIFTIAKNTCLDFLKKKRTVVFSEYETEDGENYLADNIADLSPLPPEILERTDIAQMLSAVMQKLSPEHRVVLFLHYNDHLTFREIAEALEEPIHTVKSRHRRALIMLRKLLDT